MGYCAGIFEFLNDNKYIKKFMFDSFHKTYIHAFLKSYGGILYAF